MTNELVNYLNTTMFVFFNVPIHYYKKERQFSTNFVNALDFFLELASSVTHLTLCVPASSKGRGLVRVGMPLNVSILKLPYYSDPFELIKIIWRFIPQILRISLSKTIRRSDIIGIVAPGTIFFFSFPLIHFIHKKPIFLFIRGNKKKTVQYEYGRHPFKKMVATMAISIYDSLVKLALKRDKVIMFTIGFNKEMIEKYRNKNRIYSLTPMIPKCLIKKRKEIFRSSCKRINILYLGRLSREKGVCDLLLAFSQLIKEKENEIVLHIVGSGPEESFLKEKVKQLNLKDRVIFHGFVPRSGKLWNIVDSSDIFVLPSYTEGLPRAVFEVMARGVPVICTKVGGLPEIIRNGINGLLIEPGDIISLKNVMIKLIEDPHLRNQLVEEGYKTVERVTFEKQGKKMIEIIKWRLLGLGKAGLC